MDTFPVFNNIMWFPHHLGNLSKKPHEEERDCSLSDFSCGLWNWRVQLAPVTSPWDNSMPLFAAECTGNFVFKKRRLNFSLTPSLFIIHISSCLLCCLGQKKPFCIDKINFFGGSLFESSAFENQLHMHEILPLTHLRNKILLHNTSQRFSFK